MDAPPLSEDELNSIYSWVDEIPLSRPKKNITRDFADGCMFAEIVHNYCPKIVELHNYALAHSQQQKLYNWNTLNCIYFLYIYFICICIYILFLEKVLKKMGFQISKNDIDAIVGC